MPPLFETRHLLFGYPHRWSLPLMDQSLDRGKALCILGLNGSGKSTLLKTFSSFLHPLSGDVFVGGVSTSLIPKGELFSILSFIDFDLSFPKYMRVVDYLRLSLYVVSSFWLRPSKPLEEKIRLESQRMNFTPLLKERVSELSQGQRQKAILLGAFVKESPILIMDEPTRFLDVQQKNHLLDLLGEQKKNKLIIFSTHDLDFARTLGDRFLYLNREDKENPLREVSLYDLSTNLFYPS